MDRVMITGITGYIGSHLARALFPKHEVYGLAREPLNTEYISDIIDQLQILPYDGSYESVVAALKESKPDVIYHLATFYTGAYSADVIPSMVAANITFGAYLFGAMCACGCRAFVYASSIMAHYHGESFRPLNLYAATKQALSDLLLYYTDAGLLNGITLVLSDTYGTGDHRPKILNLIMAAIQNGEHIALSDGMQDYDLVYIDDVVNAFCIAGERAEKMRQASEIYQVCAENPISLRDTVGKLLASQKLTLDAGWGERPIQKRDIRQVIRLYETLPGWKQKVPLEEGLRLFSQQYQE